MSGDRVLGPYCNCGAIVGTHRHGVSSTTGFAQPVAPTADARADAREQIAEAVATAGEGYWARADAVLAVPAVADALAAVERVRALAEELGSHTGGWDADVARMLRRALDGGEP